MGDSGDEDDYMSMAFLDADPTTAVPETSLQRRQRLRREAEIRGRPKSKQELAAEEKAAREAALSRSLIPGASAAPDKDGGDEEDPWAALAPKDRIPTKKSKGLSMMEKMGFAAGQGLGAKDNAHNAKTEPIRLSLKEDRGGIGLDAQRKRALDEAAAEQQQQQDQVNKKPKVDPLEFRERNRREREVKRWEGQVYGAQKVCERMDEERDAVKREQEYYVAEEEEDDGDGDDEKSSKKKKKRTLSTRPLKNVNVLWRGLVRRREEAERERRMRYDLEQSLSRLPTYEDDTEDADDARALGRNEKTVVYAPVEDLEEEDPELDEFNGLEPDEKLRRLVEYLRKEYRYCFWCKCSYPDEEMDGCPGLTEDDHD